jgi:hypothetical protein
MTRPSSIFRKLNSPFYALHLHGYTSHHYDHLNSDMANEEMATLVKDFISASVNIQTPLNITTAHLNLLSLLLSAATPTCHEQYHCLPLNLLVSYHTHPIYFLGDVNGRNLFWDLSFLMIEVE